MASHQSPAASFAWISKAPDPLSAIPSSLTLAAAARANVLKFDFPDIKCAGAAAGVYL
jgi:hypothetical protein